MTEPATDLPGDDTRRRAVGDLENALAELMAAFRRIYVEAAQAASPGMLPATFKLLSALARSGPTTLSELADRLTADKGLVSRQATELENLGLITRTIDPEDGRVRRISVTPLGEERLAAARQPYEHMLLTALEDWPLSSIDRLTALISALATGATPHSDDVFDDAAAADGAAKV